MKPSFSPFPAVLAWLLTSALAAHVLGGSLDQPPCQSQVIASSSNTYADSVDMDGDVIVVGDTTGIDDESFAYVYRFNGQTWVQEQVLTSGVLIGENTFGVSVAVEGDVIAVGDDNVNLIDGAAYIFRYDGSKWNKTQTLDQPEDNANTFGNSMAMDGGYLVVGAENYFIPNQFSIIGAVYIYKDNGEQFELMASLYHPNQTPLGFFGGSVAISGDLLLVGTHGSASNRAFVYRRTGGTEWVYEQELAPDLPTQTGSFGFSVAIMGNVALIGARTMGANNNGRAFIRRFNGQQWVNELMLFPNDVVGPSAHFGHDLALTGGGATAVVAADDDNGAGFASGAAWVFHHDGRQWTDGAKFTREDGGSGGSFGYALAAQDDTAAFITINENPGKLFVFNGINGNDNNGNGILDGCESPGDINGDGNVNVIDLLIVLNNWGACGNPANCPADVAPAPNGDDTVNVLDLLFVINNWG